MPSVLGTEVTLSTNYSTLYDVVTDGQATVFIVAAASTNTALVTVQTTYYAPDGSRTSDISALYAGGVLPIRRFNTISLIEAKGASGSQKVTCSISVRKHSGE
jgi:hypothetical protein